jgi:hypothetical protein
MRESWTDERLEDLNEKVGRGFSRMDARFDRVDQRFERMDERMVDRFESLYQLMPRLGVAAIVALIGLLATQI